MVSKEKEMTDLSLIFDSLQEMEIILEEILALEGEITKAK